jgi:hypothetical protein
MQSLIALLNGHQAFYITLCYVSLAVTIGLGARAIWPGWLDAVSGARLFRPYWKRGIAFLLALAATVVLFRLPAVLTDRVLNVDECAQTVGGWSLLHDPVPWRGSDNGTSGALNMYVLTAAFWVGLPVKLMTARIVMAALALILIGSTYATLLKVSGQLAAVPAALALGLFVCLARDSNHVHYNSESLSVALLAVALLLYVHGRGHSVGRLTLLYGAGLLLGAIPYAKLQAAPLGCFLAVAFALDLWRSRRGSSGWWRRLLALGLGGMSVPLLMTVVLLLTGTWQDFVTSYFGFANSYSGPSSERLAVVWDAFCGPDTPWYLLYALMVMIGPFACVDRTCGPLPRRFRLLAGAFLGYLAVAVFAVQAPGMPIAHYSTLVLHPVALLLGTCVAQSATLLADEVNRGRRLGAKVAAVWLFAATTALVAVHVGGWRVEMLSQRDFLPTLLCDPGAHYIPRFPVASKPALPVADFIATQARPGDCMSVWGWAPHYYVYAGVPNATREMTTVAAMPAVGTLALFTAGVGDTLRAYYRQRYLGDLRRARPTFFVDAVSSSEFICQDRQTLGHETWPELARFVRDNYVKVCEQRVGPGDGNRVYLLKERLQRERPGQEGPELLDRGRAPTILPPLK